MPTYNPLNLIGDYRLANKREAEGITPEWQAAKERQKAWGVPFLNFVGKAGELPYLVGTAVFSFYGYDAKVEEIDTTTELGFAIAGTVVVVKALSVLAKTAPVTDSHMVRSPKEEKLARKLNDEINGNIYGEKETKRLSKSLEILHGYNVAFTKANKYNSIEQYIKHGARFVKKAIEVAENDFMSQIKTEEEKTWVDRFIKKPLSQLIPENVKNYLRETKNKIELAEWVQDAHNNFKDSEYQNFLDKKHRNSSGSYDEFKKDMERIIKESYQEILASSIKTKTVYLINDFFKLQEENKDKKDILKKEFDEKFKEKFENISELYKKSGNEKYQILSKLAKTIVKRVDSENFTPLKFWKKDLEDEAQENAITKYIDNKALEFKKPKILNLKNIENPIIFLFERKLEAIHKEKMTPENNNNNILEAGYIEVEIDTSQFENINKNEKTFRKEPTEETRRSDKQRKIS